MPKPKTENRKLKTDITYAFIDATNIIFGARDCGWKVDLQKLLKFLQTSFKAARIFYYSGINSDDKPQLEFYEKLATFGYELRLVPLKIFNDGRRKADVDSRMTFEIMKYFDEYQHAVILTGDGDFFWVLEFLKTQKQKVTLISFKNHTARELKQLFGREFTDLGRLQKQLELTNKKRDKRS